MPKCKRFRSQNKSSSYFCSHCGEYLTRSTYFRHKKKFIDRDQSERTPLTERNTLIVNSTTDNSDPFNVSSSEEEELPCFQDVAVTNSDKVQGKRKSQTSEGEKEVNESKCEENENGVQDDEPEVWDDVPEDVLGDLPDNDPLPDPKSRPAISRKLGCLLQWFVLFILLWQANCKVSDNGLEWLLRFMFQFLHIIGITSNCDYLIELSSMFPTSLFLLRNLINLDRDDFQKFVVCPECSTLYAPGDCTQIIGGRILAKSCQNIAFKKGIGSKECGAKLAQKVILSNGSEKFYPMKVYCYNSVLNQIELMLKRPGFPAKCEKWRVRGDSDDNYSDVYDGQVWKDFLKYQGNDFLNSPRSLAFALNVDWFQPFKRRSDISVGVIYLVVQNLPREDRFRWENVILVGIIPNMKKMPKSINPFLQPMVDELKILWKGVRLHTSQSSVPLVYRGAVLCAAADIPAARKLCGFKGHSAIRACSKCFKAFPGSVKEGRDFSGFERSSWPGRCNSVHRRYANKVKMAPTKTDHEKRATQYGCYYSALLELPYFDAVRFTVIDPMHNLFLGTSKTMFQLWMSKDILNKKKLKTLESKIKEIDIGTGFGRLPHKISSNYGGYTASQWKNWTTIYSTYALHGTIPETHLNCWHTFVIACRLLSVPVLSKTNLVKADLLLLKFCRQYEELYGKKSVTVNHHLHCHLKECIEDYGPIYSFWCFAFERFNGILGNTTTNNRSIEIQIMRKFISSKHVSNVGLPQDFREHFSPLFAHFYNVLDSEDNVSVGSSLLLFAACSVNVRLIQWANISCISLPSAYKLMYLDQDDQQLLANTYSYMYPDQTIEFNSIGEVARKYSSVTLAGEKFGSKHECRSLRSARVMASWAGKDGAVNAKSRMRPAQVKFYMMHCLKREDKYEKHIFACVNWYSEDAEKEFYRSPVEVWKRKEFDVPGPACFIPVQRLYSKFAAVNITKNGCEKIVISPILRSFC